MNTATDLQTRARERLAQEEQARLERTMQELAAEDEGTQREQARQAARAALYEEAATFEQESQARIEALQAELAAALDAFVAAVYARDTGTSDLEARARALAAGGYDAVSQLRVGNVTLRPIYPRAAIVAAMERALARRYPRGTL